MDSFTTKLLTPGEMLILESSIPANSDKIVLSVEHMKDSSSADFFRITVKIDGRVVRPIDLYV